MRDIIIADTFKFRNISTVEERLYDNHIIQYICKTDNEKQDIDFTIAKVKHFFNFNEKYFLTENQ